MSNTKDDNLVNEYSEIGRKLREDIPLPTQMDLEMEQLTIDADLSEDTEASKHYIQVLDALEDATDLLSKFNPFDRTQYKEAYEKLKERYGVQKSTIQRLQAENKHLHDLLTQLNCLIDEARNNK